MQGICALCTLHNASVIYVRNIRVLFRLVYVRNTCYHILNNKTQHTTRKAITNMKKTYSYEFCLKAANYFFKKGNYKLFNRFYKLVKAEQNRMK